MSGRRPREVMSIVDSETQNPKASLTGVPSAAGPNVSAAYPAWAKELADLYFSGSVCLFVLHGNVHDVVPCATVRGTSFCSVPEFLSRQLFGSWDVVFSYDLGRGLRLEAGEDAARRQAMVEYAAARLGNLAQWPRDPDQVLAALEKVIERNLLEDNAKERKRIAFLFEYAQYLIPSGGLNMLASGQASRLVRFISWAQNPYIKRVNMAFCLIVNRLSEVNDRLVQNPHVAALEIPLPDDEARRAYVEHTLVKQAEAGPAQPAGDGLTADAIARLSCGLNLVNVNVLLSRARQQGRSLDLGQFRHLKKGLIERQCQGLVTFVQPKHNLDTVVGQVAAKQRLLQDAQWIGQGLLDTAPMGYLICGPVGTGKSFLAQCYAGSIGIPAVTLGNFRSKYVGETEGNLEQVLNVLRSLGPVVVIIDEADAALGSREAEGDSGTSARVFGMIARQMGNTDYRGRIIWMLLTSRPDLLPIDLKRQGRAEVHIPLFYPRDPAEIAEMVRVMAAKNQIPLAADAVPDASGKGGLSGADIESVLLSARRRALADRRKEVNAEDLRLALRSFIPSAQGLEKEMQELVAVLECTDREFLPAEWQERIDKPEGRTRLQERCMALRELIGQ
ncbi:MAG: ATP-binding protein [Planctomycetes bacterium]|nr:ATP-binding protein [Planctomycetota bacterium]